MAIDISKGLYRAALTIAATANRTITFPDASGTVILDTTPAAGSVLDYGAVADGATDDAAAIQAALTAGAGTTVYFPPGVYIVGTRLNVPADTTVRGAGMGATFLKHKAAYGFQVMQANGDNVLITDIAFDGNQPNNVGYGGSEVTSNGFEEVTFDRVRIFNCEAYGLDATGIRTRVINCQFEGVGLATLNESAMAVYAAGATARDVLVANCTMTGWRVGAFFGGGEGFVFANNLCIDNHLQTSPTGGGQVAMTANTKDCLIIGNRIYGGAALTSGIEVGGTPTDVNAVTITGNIITAVGLYGIILQGSGDVVITGNVIRNAGAEGIYVNPNVSGFVITGNRVYDDQGVKTCPWGVYLAAGTGDNYIVAGNDLRGNINADGLNDLALGTSRQVYGNLPTGGGESVDFPIGNGTLGLASALTAHEADTSTHGVAQVANAAALTTHEADTSTHGVAVVAGTADIATHAALPNSHHAQAHGASDHTDRTRRLDLGLNSGILNVATLVDANGPALNMANATTSTVQLRMIMPSDYVASTDLFVKWRWNSDVNGNNVVFRVRVFEVGDVNGAGTTLVDATNAFAAHATQPTQQTGSQQCTTDPTAGTNNYLTIILNRLGSDASDTNTGTVYVKAIWLEYTADA